MSAHVIANPVPSPEEMAQILGVSSERVAALRSIMGAPMSRKSSKSAANGVAFKKAGGPRTSSKVRRKR